MNLTKSGEILLYILERAKRIGVESLTSFQLMKIPYVIEVEYRKYVGESFDGEIRFVRETNGPISYNIYDLIENLRNNHYIDIRVTPNSDYGHDRHDHILLKVPTYTFLQNDEKIFLNSVIDDCLKGTQKHLKDWVYDSEPMRDIIGLERKENVSLKKGANINLNLVTLDKDIVSELALG